MPFRTDIELMRFTTCGSVDDGKSTLIGRLLMDTKNILGDVALFVHVLPVIAYRLGNLAEVTDTGRRYDVYFLGRFTCNFKR